jgi:hypothetical protein
MKPAKTPKQRQTDPRDAQRDHKEQKKQVFPQRKCVQTSRAQKHASTR